MKKINYKSDFLLVINLGPVASGGEYADAIVAGVIEKLAVSGRLMSSCCDEDYVAGGRGYKFSIGAHEQQGINCHRDRGGRLVVAVDNHRLHPGKLMMELEAMKPDGMFADGMQSIVNPVALDVELVMGAGDCACTPAEVSALMPMVEVSAYDMAVAGGFTGTQDEFIASLVKIAERLSRPRARIAFNFTDGSVLEIESDISHVTPSYGYNYGYGMDSFVIGDWGY